MTSRFAVLAGLLLIALLIVPADGWQAPSDEHATHHPEAQAGQAASPPPATPAPPARGMAGMRGMKGMNMPGADAKLGPLVQKMNAAQGQAKVDAMAELLTALVQQHEAMHGQMGQMMSKMQGKDAGAAK